MRCDGWFAGMTIQTSGVSMGALNLVEVCEPKDFEIDEAWVTRSSTDGYVKNHAHWIGRAVWMHEKRICVLGTGRMLAYMYI